MTPLQKKVCMLGGYGVGKTSLVKRFVSGMFSEKYHTTIGVKIDQKSLLVDEQDTLLVFWDLYGEDDFQKIRPNYLQGSSGYVLVIDGTRHETVAVASQLHVLARRVIGAVPFVLMVNKQDLVQEWKVDFAMIGHLAAESSLVIHTSAKTGEGVEQAFLELARQMVVT